MPGKVQTPSEVKQLIRKFKGRGAVLLRKTKGVKFPGLPKLRRRKG
jgi:hypothetical protein